MVQIKMLAADCGNSVCPCSGDTDFCERWDTEYRARIPVTIPA